MNATDIASWLAAITGVISVYFLSKKMWDNRQQWEVTVYQNSLEKPEIPFHIRQWGQGKRIQIATDGDTAVAIFEDKLCKKYLAKLFITNALYPDKGIWWLQTKSNDDLINRIRREKPIWCRIFYEIPRHLEVYCQ